MRSSAPPPDGPVVGSPPRMTEPRAEIHQTDALPLADRTLERVALLGALVHAALLPISTAGMRIGLGIALAALVLLRVRGRRAWAHGPLDLPVLLLAGAGALSVAVAAATGSPPSDWHKATSWTIVLSPLVLFSTLRLGRTEAEVRRRALLLAGAWAVGSFAPSALAWVQYSCAFDPLHALGLRRDVVLAPAPRGGHGYAAVGFFRWYTALAHNLLPPVCLAAALALHRDVPRRLRWLLALAALAAGAAIVLTVSRAAWVTLVLGVALSVLLAGRGWRWALGIVLAAAIAAAAHPALRARVAAIGEHDAVSDRQLIWRMCGEMVKDRPLTGWGWGNIPARSVSYWERVAPEFPLRAWCHDSFFTAWTEGGPVLAAALVAFWVLLFAAFWRWWRGGGLARAAAAGALAAMTATLLNSLVHDILQSSESALGLFFAVAVAAAIAAPIQRARPSTSR